MSAKRFGLQGPNQNVEFGKLKLKSISDDSASQAKSNDELSLVEIKALDGTTDQSAVTKAQLNADVAGATDLGTFTGATISDNNTVKGALQELETKVEDVAGTVEGICRKYSFAYTDGTFNLGNVIPAGKWIRKVSVQVGTPLNDIAATMKIGISGNAEYLMAASENDLQDAGLYEVGMLKKLASDTQLIVTLDAGTSTQGDGDILIEYC